MVELVECQFCGQFLEDEEEIEAMEPVFVGSPPSNSRVGTAVQVEKKEQVIGRATRQNGVRDVQVLGRRFDELYGIIEALESSDDFTLETRTGGVYEPDFSGSLNDSANQKMDRLLNQDKIGVEITAEVKHNHSPDMEVCQYCADNLRGGSDD